MKQYIHILVLENIRKFKNFFYTGLFFCLSCNGIIEKNVLSINDGSFYKNKILLNSIEKEKIKLAKINSPLFKLLKCSLREISSSILREETLIIMMKSYKELQPDWVSYAGSVNSLNTDLDEYHGKIKDYIDGVIKTNKKSSANQAIRAHFMKQAALDANQAIRAHFMKQAALEYTDASENTFLHVAVINKDINSIKEVRNFDFLSKKINDKNYYGDTPLHLAVRLGYKDIVSELIKYTGIDFNPKNQNGMTPLHLAIISSMYAFSDIKSNDYNEILQILCGHSKFDICEENNSGNNALHIVAAMNFYNLLEFLISRTINIQERNTLLSKTNKQGDTVLHLAAALNNPESVSVILKYSGTHSLLPYRKNSNEETPIDLVKNRMKHGYKCDTLVDILKIKKKSYETWL